MFEWINLCTDVCIYNCLFGLMDIRENVFMSLALLVVGGCLKNGFLLAKMCCFL